MAIEQSNISLVRKWIQALRESGPSGDNVLTDAIINPLTTVQGLFDAVNNGYATPKGPNDLRNCRATLEAINYLGPTTTPFFGYGIIGNSDVAAANTFDGLVSAIVTNSALPTNEQETDNYLQGNTQYFGNVGTGSNI